MSESQSAGGGETLHVVADRGGNIVAAGYMRSGRSGAHEVRVRLMPLEGQLLVQVPSTHEIGMLRTAEDFRRLVRDFHVPSGQNEVLRRLSETGA